MQGHLLTLAVVALIGGILALPTLWLQRRLARPRKPPVARVESAKPHPEASPGPDRSVALERELYRVRAELQAAHATLDLHRALNARYEQLIERLSPGLLAASPRQAEGAPSRQDVAA